MLPAAPAVAVQGDVTLDESAYTALGGSNIVTVTVEDSDLDTPSSLAGNFEILAVADGVEDTFEVASDPIDEVSSAFDLQTGTGYFAVVSEDNTEVTLHVARAQNYAAVLDVDGISTNTAATTVSQTGADAPTLDDAVTAFKLTVTDVADGTDTVVAISVAGTSINASTLVTTAGDSETLSFNVSDTAASSQTTSKYWLGDVDIDPAAPTSGEYNLDVYETRVIAVRYTYDEPNNTDYTDDDDATQQSLNLKSSSSSSGVDLTLTEDGDATGSFDGEAALVSEANLESITDVITSAALDDDVDTIAELIAALDALPDDAGEDASTWATATTTALTGVTTASVIEDLVDVSLKVAHGDTITATYDDQGDSADSDTATVDMEAPVISGVAPADGTYTNDQTPRFTATITDGDSGVDLLTLDVSVNSIDVTDDVSSDPVTDGYDLEFIGGATELGADPGDPAASYDWSVSITDEVGNVATTDDDGDAITFTIDTVDPDLDSAVTGIGIKLDASDADDDDETDDYIEFSDPGWIKLTFDEDVDVASLSVGDFEVDGDAPDGVVTSGGEDILNLAGTADLGNADAVVYLQVSDLDADDTPEIGVVDDIDDLSGNSLDDLTDDDVVDASDSIDPTLTITLSATLGADEDEITITVASDEDLDDLDVTVENGELSTSAPVTMTRTGTTDVWTGDYEIGDSAVFTVDASGVDSAANTGEEDAEFEGDIGAPTVAATANTVDITTGDPEVEEGSVWIVTTFGDDEYDDDSHKTVTVTAVSLEDEDGNSVSADVADLFTDDDKVFTLAVTLDAGDYTFSITADDDAGNEADSGDLEFAVTARASFDIDLLPGVNLVSIPSAALGDGGNINVLLEDLPVTSVMTYDRSVDVAGGNPWLASTVDAETGVFSGDIATLEPGKAYFVTATASTTIEVDLAPVSVTLPPRMQVLQGFNSIGFWSISGDSSADMDAYLNSISWSVAYSFSPVPGEGWDVFRPDEDLSAGDNAEEGIGYLVYVTEDGTLTP